MTDSGEVWIWVRKTLTSSKLMIVDDLVDATVLETSAAEQISRKAKAKYRNYLWQTVPVREQGKVVVRGERRPTL